MKKGLYCVYNDWIKTYKTKALCDYAYTKQHEWYLMGIAPKPLDRIDEYSFKTEVADTKFFMDNFKEWVYYDVIFPELAKKVKELLKDNSYSHWANKNCDLARHNLGLYKWKVVLIDFT